MKHSFLRLPAQPRSYAPKIVSRRSMGRNFDSVAYKSDAEVEKEKLLTDIGNSVKTELEKRGYQSKDDVQTFINDHFKGVDLDAIRKYKTDKDESDSTVRTLAEKIEKLEKRAGGRGEKPQTIAEQIRTQINKDQASKDKFAAFKRGEIRQFELQLRAPAAMTIAASGSSGIPVPEAEQVPGLIDLPRNRPFMLSISNAGNTDKSAIEWVEKFNPEGQAEFIGEGELKPLIDFNYRKIRSEAKKAAAKIKSSTEQLDDIDWMAAEIENELRYQVELAASTGLLSGDGTGDNLKGLDSYAGGFTLTSVETTDPNNADAIRAAIAQIRSLNFNANVAVLNPIDVANMELEKATDGHYIIPPFKSADGTVISGVRVIEENGIPVGSVLVGDMTRFRVRVYKPFSVSYGWVNDDFEKNMVTIIGEMRLHSFVPTNDIGAFVYDTLANIKTAITAA